MGILSLQRVSSGAVSTAPGEVRMLTTDSLATVTTAGYINQNWAAEGIGPTDIFKIIYSFANGSGTYEEFTVSVNSSGVITLNQWTNPGDVLLPVVSHNVAQFNGTAGQINDSNVAISSLVLNSSAAGQSIAVSTSSATPGTIRSVTGAMTETTTTMTSGNLVGVRGSVSYVGASGGFLYGTQGKLIPTGTLSGSSWNAGVFGQFDLSASTINAGQIAAIWGDMGASGGTFTDVTGARMFAGTNTISTLTLNSMIYLYGKATNLFELSGSSSTYITSGGGGSIGGTIKKIALTIDGATYYLVAGTTIT